MSFFGTVLTVIVTLLQIYVFYRLYKLPAMQRYISRKAIIITAFSIWLLYYLSRVFGGHEGLVRIILEFFGMHWLGTVFLLSVGLFLSDLISGFGLFFRKNIHRIRAAGLLFGIFMAILAHIQGLRPPAVKEVNVAVKNLQKGLEGTTIAILADTHAGEMGIGPEWMNARVRQVLALKPDMIVLAGDLFERASDPDEMIPVMRKFKAPMGVWAVRGNHDTRRPNRRDVTGEILHASGIGLLENRWVKAADHLIVAGIDDLTSSSRREGESQRNIDMAFKDIPEGNVILLSHTPWMTDIIADNEADLMISGHTHNGQIWPFNYIIRTRYPFVAGKYESGDFTLLVNRGTGTWGPRMRLWEPGEISLVRLYNKER